MPLYSYMVALATDLLCGGVSHLDLFISCLYGNVLMFGLIWIYLPFCKHEHFVPHSHLLLHPKPISSTNLLKSLNDMYFHHIC
jgi:hypothetical protein